jgi:lipopolysaccharide transport system permease protein
MIADYVEIYQRRALIRRMASSQLQASLHRTVLGSGWLLLTPALQIAMYYVLVAVIFQRGSGPDYFVLLVMGIMHYNIFQQSVSSASSVITGSGGMLLQIKMNPILLIGVSFSRSARTALLGVLLFFVVYFVAGKPATSKMLFYPAILLSWLVLTWSVCVIIATISVYSRDLQSFLRYLLQLMLYLSPVIYAADHYPQAIRNLFFINPVATHFSLLQWMFFDGQLPPVPAIVALPLIVVATLLFAHYVFDRGKRNFTKTL